MEMLYKKLVDVAYSFVCSLRQPYIDKALEEAFGGKFEHGMQAEPP